MSAFLLLLFFFSHKPQHRVNYRFLNDLVYGFPVFCYQYQLISDGIVVITTVSACSFSIMLLHAIAFALRGLCSSGPSSSCFHEITRVTYKWISINFHCLVLLTCILSFPGSAASVIHCFQTVVALPQKCTHVFLRFFSAGARLSTCWVS